MARSTRSTRRFSTLRACSAAAAAAALLLLTTACGSLGPTLGSPDSGGVVIPEPRSASAETPPSGDDAQAAASEATPELKRAERIALQAQRRMVRLEREFITLLDAGERKKLQRKALEVRDSYLALASATDTYRRTLRSALGSAGSSDLLAPYKKQANGLRLAAEGVNDYRRALKSDDAELARRGLAKMARAEALMKQAGAELDAAAGTDTTTTRLF